MSDPVNKFSVATNTTPVVVDAQTFSVTPTGALILCSASSQTVAAFAPGYWETVTPVVSQ